MISPAYCRTMARYNRWQNENLLTAAEALDDAARRQDRGAFFGSIAGTLSHLLWGDLIWMSRFDGGDKPTTGIPGSAALFPDWAPFRVTREAMDGRIIGWADALTDDGLSGDLFWYSGVLQGDVRKPMALCITHFFNHQTHHRGQVHAMLTAAGARPGDTDLFAMPSEMPETENRRAPCSMH